jgi:hypothetical protein
MPKKRTAPTKKRQAPILPSTTNNLVLSTSSEFPPGYGDIEIHSSDGIVISFQRNVLTRVSPVFKEMLSSTENGNVLILTEPATLIEHFLSFIDTEKKPQPFSKDTIVPFLEATTKYRTTKIVTKVEKMATGKKDPLQALCKEEPMFILSIAERFRLPKLGAAAMAQAIKAPREKVLTTEYPISPTSFVQIMEQRGERAAWLHNKVWGAIKARGDFEGELPDSEPEYRPFILYDPSKEPKPKPKDPEHTAHCEDCSNMLLGAIIFVGASLHTEPSWWFVLFEMCRFMRRDKCEECGANWREESWDELSRMFGNRERSRKTRLQAFRTLRDDVISLESTPVPLRSLTSQ